MQKRAPFFFGGGMLLAVAGIALWQLGAPGASFVPLNGGSASANRPGNSGNTPAGENSGGDLKKPTSLASQTKLTAIQWQKTWDDALEKSRVTGKPIMVDFYTDWCGFCKKMESEVFTHTDVIAESANFVSVRINAEKHPDLAQRFRVDGFPTIIWIDSQGATIDRCPGYADAPEFVQWMRSAAAKGSPPVV